jgi:hypothetical protein
MSPSGGFSSNDVLSSLTYKFAGVWSGPLVLTYLDSGDKTNCSGETKLLQPKNGFIIDYGNFICGSETYLWPYTAMTVFENRLYLDTIHVGDITPERVVYVDITGDTLTQIEVWPQTLNTMNLKVTYKDISVSPYHAYATLEGPLTRQ